MVDSHKKNITSLPTEIIDQIASSCCQSSLLALCYAGRRYKQCSQRQLFREVISSPQPTPPKDWCTASRIYSIASFQHALSSNLALHWHIKAVYLAWNGFNNTSSDAFEEAEKRLLRQELENSVSHVLYFLLPLPSLERLHLAPPSLDFEVPKLFGVDVAASVTLSVYVNVECDEDERPDFVCLLRAFNLPYLRTICLENMHRLNCEVPAPLCRSGFSTIQHLRITNAGPPCKELTALLAWPKQLRSLSIETNVDGESGWSRYVWDSGKWEIAGLIEALQPQKKNLENISLSIQYEYGVNGDSEIAGRAFQEFSSLRVLDVPLDHLFQLPDYVDDHYYEGPMFPIHEVLPQSLEKLVLFLDFDFPWFEKDVWERDKALALSGALAEVFKWLQGILSHTDHLTSINSVVLKGSHIGNVRLGPAKELIEAQDLVREFKQHDITLDTP